MSPSELRELKVDLVAQLTQQGLADVEAKVDNLDFSRCEFTESLDGGDRSRQLNILAPPDAHHHFRSIDAVVHHFLTQEDIIMF